MINYTKNGDSTPKNAKKRNVNNQIGIEELEPWADPVDGQTLFKDVTDVFKKYLVLQDYNAEALVLWSIFSHCYDASDIAPKLLITSPEKRCGKTTLMDVLTGLVRKPTPSSNITPAALFRIIDGEGGTIMIDEADTFISKNSEINGILNSGHRRSQAFVKRCEGDNYNPRTFSTWAPTIIAMIKKPADTLVDRSIVIEMRRKLPDEQVKKFRYCKGMPELQILARKIARWCDDNFDALCEADPLIPEGLHDRAEDNWTPLLAIAEALGGECADIARKTAAAINESSVEEDDETPSILLLGDIKEIMFVHAKDGKIFSDDIRYLLPKLSDKPWGAWNWGKEISFHQISKLLKPFGIRAKKIRIGREVKQGFECSQFEDAFSRYLSGTTEHNNDIRALEGIDIGTVPEGVPEDMIIKPLNNNDSSGVPENEKSPPSPCSLGDMCDWGALTGPDDVNLFDD